MPIVNQTKAHKEQAQHALEIGENGVRPQRLFTDEYIDAVFTTWYSAGKPNARRLALMCPNPADFGLQLRRPSEPTLLHWIPERFQERAKALDAAVGLQIDQRLIAEKVEMLNRHAQLATNMQTIALNYLVENKEKLNPNSAVRLLVEGVRIERESVGIPRTLEKLTDQSDEELLKQLTEIIDRSPIQTLPWNGSGDLLPEDLEDMD